MTSDAVGDQNTACGSSGGGTTPAAVVDMLAVGVTANVAANHCAEGSASSAGVAAAAAVCARRCSSDASFDAAADVAYDIGVGESNMDGESGAFESSASM